MKTNTGGVKGTELRSCLGKEVIAEGKTDNELILKI